MKLTLVAAIHGHGHAAGAGSIYKGNRACAVCASGQSLANVKSRGLLRAAFRPCTKTS
jgi:hypothetical protein